MVDFVAVFAAPISLKGGALEVVSEAIEEVDLVVVDVVRSTFLLVEHHGLSIGRQAKLRSEKID